MGGETEPSSAGLDAQGAEADDAALEEGSQRVAIKILVSNAAAGSIIGTVAPICLRRPCHQQCASMHRTIHDAEGAVLLLDDSFEAEDAPVDGVMMADGDPLGKGGVAIGELQRISDTHIQLSQATEHFPGTSERMALVTGDLSKALMALHLIFARLKNEGLSTR